MGRFTQALLSLTLFTVTCCQSTQKTSESVRQQAADRQSNLKMYDFHIQSFVDTKLAWDVKAPVGELYTNSNVIRMSHMQSTFYENGQRSGGVESGFALMATGPSPQPLNGIALHDDGDVYLSTNVVMVSTDGTKVLTDWARYSHKNDMITSSAPVQVVRRDSVTNGVGMEARPDMSDLKIFNQTLTIPGNDDEN